MSKREVQVEVDEYNEERFQGMAEEGKWAQDRKELRRPQVVPLLSGRRKMGPRQEGVEETASRVTPLRELEDGPKTGRSGGDHKSCHSSQGAGRWAQDRKEWRRRQVVSLLSGSRKMGPR